MLEAPTSPVKPTVAEAVPIIELPAPVAIDPPVARRAAPRVRVPSPEVEPDPGGIHPRRPSALAVAQAGKVPDER